MEYSKTLRVKVVSANLLHQTELLRSMSPYCEVSVENQVKRTQVKKHSGKHPRWEEEMLFTVFEPKSLRVEVWDLGKAAKKDLVGFACVDASQLVRDVNCFQQTNLVYRKNGKLREAGKVALELKLTQDKHCLKVHLDSDEPRIRRVSSDPGKSLTSQKAPKHHFCSLFSKLFHGVP